MFSGYFQEALLFKNVIRNIFFIDRHLEAFPRHEEFCNNIVLPVLFDNEWSGRKVRRSGKVDPCHAIAPAEVFKCEALSCCPFYVHIVKPCDRRILFDIAELRQELRFCCKWFLCNCDLVFVVFPRYGNAQVRVWLLQFFAGVPLFHVVNDKQERKKAFFRVALSSAFQERRWSLHKFVVNAVVLISCSRRWQNKRLFSGSQCRRHNVVLFQALIARPCFHFVV